MYKYFISFSLLFVFVDGFSQDKKSEVKETEKDTIVYKSAYGFRLGMDISKPIKALFDASYSGFEIVGDYRVNKRFFIAAEVGFEENTTKEDYTNSTVKGSYARIGFNFNAYENWLDMNNEIIAGYRYGFSLFDQTLNSYTPNVNSLYFPANTITVPQTATSLNAHWSEFVFGLKVETLNNLFVSFSVSYKILMSVKDPENFKTLYAPGFNRIFESNTGFGFNYTLTYLIPFVNK
ncbi:hypothetical protein BTO04_02910 [Polaribacter sp. SA4-10]|uniref:DUF6048 family protein n=1 Tax=Polaribacter sp. SA4-10 TaxID=754397 RepID=UPI000B3CD704|nr:DUF6048 family protein [Polaribacter sp. SA4-10]ARV05710.1 hypothetical protein BTO04_02910 [Polaribacter sp. SA4-10]